MNNNGDDANANADADVDDDDAWPAPSNILSPRLDACLYLPTHLLVRVPGHSTLLI